MAKSVLFVGAYPKPAALERYVSGDLALRLQSLDWKIRVTSRRMGRVARALEILLDIWRWRSQYAIACVDVFSGPAFTWAEAACAQLRNLGKPYVLTLHGGNLPAFSRLHPGRVRALLSTATAVTCPSPYLLAEMWSLRSDLVLLPNGLDLSRYALRAPERRAPTRLVAGDCLPTGRDGARRSHSSVHGLEARLWSAEVAQARQPPQRHLIWLRAFHAIYNPVLAVEVLARIRTEYPEVRLTMIGPDKRDGSLQQAKAAAHRLGVAPAVSFRGPIPKSDVPWHLAQAGIFLNTANCDNTPVSVLEALACGLAVVSTKVGGIPFLLDHGRTALLVPPGDAAEMAAAVCRLQWDPELAAQLGANGRKLAESFGWSIILPQWEKILAEAANESTIQMHGPRVN
jgi:glycosyltransferase involved in cell wall biosynthesis